MKSLGGLLSSFSGPILSSSLTNQTAWQGEFAQVVVQRQRSGRRLFVTLADGPHHRGVRLGRRAQFGIAILQVGEPEKYSTNQIWEPC
jgi:hypothetical protein